MGSVIGQHFSSAEVIALVRGSVDFGAISPSLLVPFAARRLKNAKVAWINVRWFLQRGIDVTDKGTRNRVENWFVDEFGYALIGDPRTWPTNETKHFHADRYGSTDGTTPHGGSGRSGIAGRFCAKGIGPTPLVGRNAAPGHAHGCATLEECLREAAYAEVIDAEFPFGAVPVIGVLDTGLKFDDPDAPSSGSRRVRRGILIRPCVPRPAHAERAPLFRQLAASDDQTRSSQRHDVARSKAVIQHWLDTVSTDDSKASPKTLVGRLARQIAFSQVHRISSGGMFSSNVSLSGAFLDFGNAHALPDWSRAKLLDHGAAFGEEMATLRAIVKSLAFFLNKYGAARAHVVPEQELQEHAYQCYVDEFARESLRIFNIDQLSDASAPLAEIVRGHFKQQQQQRVRYRYGRVDEVTKTSRDQEWLGDTIRRASMGNVVVLETHSSLMQDIVTCLKRTAEGEKDPERFVAGALITARRYFARRADLDRATFIAVVAELVAAISRSGKPLAATIEDAIDRMIGNSRMHWRQLPRRLVVRAKKAFGSSCALLCVDLACGTPIMWLEGVYHEGRFRLFDRWLTYGRDELEGLQRAGGLWSALVSVPSFSSWYLSASEISQILRSAPGTFEWFDSSAVAERDAISPPCS